MYLAAVEDNDELARLVGGIHESARGREERTLGRDEAVGAVLGEEVHGDGGVVAPRDELVGAELTVGEVDVRRPVDVAEADLRVHGEVHGPHVLLLLVRLERGPLDRRVVAEVPPVLLRLDAPPAIVLGLDEELRLVRLALGISLHVAIAIDNDVPVEVGLDVDVVLTLLLQDKRTTQSGAMGESVK
jgi:hypothetical protein